MKKSSGITRNRITNLTDSKTRIQRKKTRFQSINKNDQSFQTSAPNSRTDQGTLTSSSVLDFQADPQQKLYKIIYQNAKNKIHDALQLKKKISTLTKSRLTSFKQKQNQRYDETISTMASEATALLIDAEKYLKDINAIKEQNSTDDKVIASMGQSLALEIREASRQLRQQQKQYFDTIRSYEKNTKNSAIELSEEQKIMMKSFEEEQMQEEKNDLLNNQKIDELVRNINKLSVIYKQLNCLVIEQGSLIDRIDINIDSTLLHTKKAVVHLQAAQQHANSALADRVMKVLLITIVILAVVLGLKWMA